MCGKITQFISHTEIYTIFFSFFNNKWGNFAKALAQCQPTHFAILIDYFN